MILPSDFDLELIKVRGRLPIARESSIIVSIILL